MSKGVNVAGTSTPSCRSPSGRPAENNRINFPLRINPTSPILMRLYMLAGEGCLDGMGFYTRGVLTNDVVPQGVAIAKEGHLSMGRDLGY